MCNVISISVFGIEFNEVSKMQAVQEEIPDIDKTEQEALLPQQPVAGEEELLRINKSRKSQKKSRKSHKSQPAVAHDVTYDDEELGPRLSSSTMESIHKGSKMDPFAHMNANPHFFAHPSSYMAMGVDYQNVNNPNMGYISFQTPAALLDPEDVKRIGEEEVNRRKEYAYQQELNRLERVGYDPVRQIAQEQVQYGSKKKKRGKTACILFLITVIVVLLIFGIYKTFSSDQNDNGNVNGAGRNSREKLRTRTVYKPVHHVYYLGDNNEQYNQHSDVYWREEYCPCCVDDLGYYNECCQVITAILSSLSCIGGFSYIASRDLEKEPFTEEDVPWLFTLFACPCFWLCCMCEGAPPE